MKKLMKDQLRTINGGIMPGQCFYLDPATGKRIRGCLTGQGTWIDGVWYEYAPEVQNSCHSCLE
ncbi:hypothetical protein CMT42_01840 [Elizabethkingia anophelis]|uniref:Bacteriocin n=2 Tax=Weeksellaceae TaxID=2762318 RepID=X5K4W4_9FLAO|nr:hypothetical protein [Elizabethkingia anophelis]AMR40642.1 hypothetical protein A2T74_04385 [Elizabethkingia anophelis]AMX47277.1 hypothetical protein A4C56_04385 [Elizabethkingia anophelis]AMX50738.1 hypothetical protein A2T72_04385 [Elizabethkingia anophelis]AMX54130.1 hypothetical protein A2T59_04385 [Elizabethkingia anophelis]AQW99301.1 hypothetical protein BBD31_16010 [Elizabethkingia anophelis]